MSDSPYIHRSKSCPENVSYLQEEEEPSQAGPANLAAALEYGSITDTSLDSHSMAYSNPEIHHGPAEQYYHQETPIPMPVPLPPDESRFLRLRHKVGSVIETKAAHIIILGLTVIDITLVMLQIGASLLHLDETKEEVWFIALFSHLSLAIVSLFTLEVLLKIFAFGPRYFWKGTRHGVLHLLDAIIILISFLLEIFLHGAAQELTSLLIIFRLWRVVKLTGTVAIEVSEYEEAHMVALHTRIQSLERELEESRIIIHQLENPWPSG
ncbi:MAG: hypothetical protein J3Q66DRAFT_191970 [Benniella sp.]|nr:MAG: hypothetical protein J3Q66DRAFT_191970 [Benniella sp.]